MPIAAESGVPVIYIASHARSGSTLVGSVLGLLDDHVYVGEIREVWRDGLIGNQSCGCGARFRDCPFWTDVFRRAFGGFDTPEVAAAAAGINRLTRLPDTLSLFALAWNFPRGHGADPAYTRPLAKLYAAIQAVSGARVIVDSSKTMRYGALVAAAPGIDIHLVNLIRDPRGIVQSRARQARYRDGSLKPAAAGYGRYRVVRIIAKWAARNALAARVLKRDGGVRLLYEDFVRSQTEFLATIAGQEKAGKVGAMLRDGIPAGLVQHQIAGNWVKGLRIVPDESWRTGLPWLQRSLAALLSYPLRVKYRSEFRKAGETASRLGGRP